MAYQTPYGEPTKIEAGDLVRWKLSLADFPATTESWTLKYYLVPTTGTPITITASADTTIVDDYLVNVATTTTANWTAGTYYWDAYVSKSGARHFIGRGVIEIEGDMSVVTTADQRTDAKIIYDALIASYTDRATRPEKAYSLQAAGRSFTFKTDEEYQKAIEYWGNKVKQEAWQDAINAGKGGGNHIRVRFT